MICPICGNWINRFQPELFDSGRGRYECHCGYQSGRVFEKNEKQPAGWSQQTADAKENALSEL